MNRTTNLTDLENGAPFTWGELIKIHKFFSYAIVQCHPHEFKDGISTRRINTRKHEYHIYVDNKDASESFDKIDSAIAACIAYRHEGANHRADGYFIKSITK